jgi:hypothetical protein
MQIAAAERVALDTVKSRIQRGLATLRARLAPAGDGRALALLLAPLLANRAPPAAGVATVSVSTAAAVGATWTGVTTMASMTTRLALGGALLLTTGAAAWHWRSRPQLTRSESAATHPGDAAVLAPEEALPDPVPVERSEAPVATGSEGSSGSTGPAPGTAPIPPAPPRPWLSGLVVDSLQQPVEGAVVALLPAGEQEARSLESFLGSLLLHGIVLVPRDGRHAAMSEADGRFEFATPAAETTRVWSIGAAAADVGATLLTEVTLDPDRKNESQRLELSDGVRLVGRVQDRDGAAVPSARVTIFTKDGERDRLHFAGREVFRIDADADGAFRSAALPFRSFRLEAHAATDALRTRLAAGETHDFDVPAGQRERRVDVTLPDVRTIRGDLRTTAGAPAGEFLRAALTAAEISGSGNTPLHLLAQNVDARWSTGELKPPSGVGPMWIRTVRDAVDLQRSTFELRLTEPWCRHLGLFARGRLLAFAEIPLTDTPISLVIDPARLPAERMPATVRLSILDAATGTPFPRGDVVAEFVRREGDMTVMDGAIAPVDLDGRATIEAVPCEATFSVLLEGFVSERRSAVLRSGETSEVALVVQAAPGRVCGVVRGEEGQPIRGAAVRAYLREDDGADVKWRPLAHRMAHSDGAGAFAIEELPLGTLLLVAGAAGLAPASRVVNLSADDSAATSTVTSAAESAVHSKVEFELTEGVAIALSVGTSAGRELNGLRLMATNAEGVPLLDDLAGNHAFGRELTETLRLPPGTVRFEAFSLEHRPARATLDIAPGATLRLDFVPLDD